MKNTAFLLDELYQAFLKIETKKECEQFLSDLCTKTELISMSQRLEAAKMLLDGKTYSEVTEATDISSATLAKVSKCVRYGDGGYENIIKKQPKTPPPINYWLCKDGTLLLPEDITEIPDRAFAEREDILKVKIPDGVTAIGMNAFFECKNLQTLVIPHSVRFILIDALYGTPAVVYYAGTVEEWKTITELEPPANKIICLDGILNE